MLEFQAQPSAFFSSQHRPSLTRSERLRFEELEPRTMLDATLMISEFLAANSNGIQDEDGDSSDWIEIFNPTSSAVNSAGVAPD